MIVPNNEFRSLRLDAIRVSIPDPIPIDISDATETELTTPRFIEARHRVEALSAALSKRLRKRLSFDSFTIYEP